MVSRIARKEIMGLSDVMSTENFVMMFANIPFSDADPYQCLTLPCQTAVIPGTHNEAFAVTMGSYTRMFRGRSDFSHDLTLTYAVTRDMKVLKALRQWHEGTAGTASQTSQGYHADYSTRGDLYLFDTAGKSVEVATFYGLFPRSVPEFSLDEGRTSPMIGQAQFVYDYVEYASIKPR